MWHNFDFDIVAYFIVIAFYISYFFVVGSTKVYSYHYFSISRKEMDSLEIIKVMFVVIIITILQQLYRELFEQR